METSRRRILVRAPNWVGDHVLALRFYHLLRRRYPQASMTLLSRLNLKDLCPEEFNSHLTLPAECRTFVDWIRYGRSLKGQFDLGISLPAHYSSPLIFLAAGIRNRIGFSRGGNEILLTSHQPWLGRQAGRHKSSLFLDLFQEEDTITPQMNSQMKTSRWIVIAPGASIPLREWPYFPELLEYLSRNYPHYRLIAVGSDADAKWTTIFSRLNLKNFENKIGQTTLPELITLCKRAHTVICNDSGVAHIAATLASASTFTFFGPGDPDYIAPEGKVTVLRNSELRCSPCESARCTAPYGYQACLRELSLDSVVNTLSPYLHG